jgi:3-methyladenine DNA glycosylase AlkC
MQSGSEFRSVFNKGSVARLSADIQRVYTDFDRKGFERRIVPRLDGLGLLERSDLITEALKEFLPQDFPRAVDILLRAVNDASERPTQADSGGFMLLPQTMYIARFGLKHYDVSMRALNEMTKHFTAEFAIRPFIQAYPERTLKLLRKWTRDLNPHVRRLVSEGTRPRLPWASRLPEFQTDPQPVLALLEELKEDPELYVRRSVANNLNDIAKDHPDLVVETLQRWRRVDNPGTQWIIGHALRTLLKQGHPGALALQGFGETADVDIRNLAIDPPSVTIGHDAILRCAIVSRGFQPQRLMIDYVVHFVKANGRPSPKVFKLSKKTLLPGDTLIIEKRIPFQAITTRKYYPGPHRLELQINGVIVGGVDFELVEQRGDKR